MTSYVRSSLLALPVRSASPAPLSLAPLWSAPCPLNCARCAWWHLNFTHPAYFTLAHLCFKTLCHFCRGCNHISDQWSTVFKLFSLELKLLVKHYRGQADGTFRIDQCVLFLFHPKNQSRALILQKDSNITFLFWYKRHFRNELVWNHFHRISNDPYTEIAVKSALHLGGKKLETRQAFKLIDKWCILMTINASKAHKCDGNVGHGDKKLVTAAAQWPLENSLKTELHCSSGSHFDHPTTTVSVGWRVL